MHWNGNTAHEWKSPNGNTTSCYIAILVACLALFIVASGALGYIGFLAEYCWFSPNELISCESYQTATAVIRGASWLAKPVTALAIIGSAIHHSHSLLIRRPRGSHGLQPRRADAGNLAIGLEDPWTNKRSPSYDEAVQTAALMFLASLRDYINSPYSALQLNLLRNRIDILKSRNCASCNNVRTVFADVRERAADLLSVELLAANVGDQVAKEVILALYHLLKSAEDAFQSTTGERMTIQCVLLNDQ
jgi:hypothetical protein